MDSEQKIREFVNNEDTKEIVNFLFDLPTPAFKFWGGLIKQSYKSKILEGSGVIEALKVEEEQKELRKEAAILALLLKGNLLRSIVNWSGAARSVYENSPFDNSLNLKHKTFFINDVGHFWTIS